MKKELQELLAADCAILRINRHMQLYRLQHDMAGDPCDILRLEVSTLLIHGGHTIHIPEREVSELMIDMPKYITEAYLLAMDDATGDWVDGYLGGHKVDYIREVYSDD